MEDVKTIRVAAAIIEKDGKILTARRSYGDYEGYWEFPGGKYEKGETGEETIVREIAEEFDAMIRVKGYLCTVEHQYEAFHLVMDCYTCELMSDDLILHDHSEYRWIDPWEEIDYLPADRKVIETYRKKIARLN